MNKQIWPPVDSDLGDPDSFWDDSELVARYDEMDAILKEKVEEAYNQYCKNSSSLDKSKKPKITSSTNYHTKNHSKDIESQPKSSIQSKSHGTCHFQWIPKILNPPDALFNKFSCSNCHTDACVGSVFSKLRSSLSDSTCLRDWEPVLKVWYEAGYKLGRVHALKQYKNFSQ